MSPSRKNLTLVDVATIVATTGIGAIALWVATKGPSGLIPMHFGLDGAADGWGDRTQMAMSLGFLAGVLALTAGGLSLAAKRATDAGRSRSLTVAQTVLVIAISGVALMMSHLSLGGANRSMASALPMAGLGLLFAAIGAVFGRVGPNPFVGVRTPWAYKSRLAWDQSNRLLGRLWFWTGLAGAGLSPIAPQPVGSQALLAVIIVSAVLAAVESWRVWRTDPDRQPF